MRNDLPVIGLALLHHYLNRSIISTLYSIASLNLDLLILESDQKSSILNVYSNMAHSTYKYVLCLINRHSPSPIFMTFVAVAILFISELRSNNVLNFCFKQ